MSSQPDGPKQVVLHLGEKPPDKDPVQEAIKWMKAKAKRYVVMPSAFVAVALVSAWLGFKSGRDTLNVKLGDVTNVVWTGAGLALLVTIVRDIRKKKPNGK